MHIAHTIKKSKCTHIILNGDFTESSRLLSLLNTVSLDIRLDLFKYFLLSLLATNVEASLYNVQLQPCLYLHVTKASIAAYIVRI